MYCNFSFSFSAKQYMVHTYLGIGSHSLLAYIQEIEFMKEGSFTLEELDALASVLQLAGQPKNLELKARGDAARTTTLDKTIASLEGMGVKIYGLKQPNVEHPKVDISWDNIAGYDNQKRYLEYLHHCFSVL